MFRVLLGAWKAPPCELPNGLDGFMAQKLADVQSVLLIVYLLKEMFLTQAFKQQKDAILCRPLRLFQVDSLWR